MAFCLPALVLMVPHRAVAARRHSSGRRLGGVSGDVRDAAARRLLTRLCQKAACKIVPILFWFGKTNRTKTFFVPLANSPFRLRCMAWSTATVTGKDSSSVTAARCTAVMSGVALVALQLSSGLVSVSLGVAVKLVWSSASASASSGMKFVSSVMSCTPSRRCSSSLSGSIVLTDGSHSSSAKTPVMWTLTAAPCRSAADRRNNG